MLNRRDFLKTAITTGAVSSCPFFFKPLWAEKKKKLPNVFVDYECRYYTKLSRERIQCHLCPKECFVNEGSRGFCRVHVNRGGKYYTLVHSNPCAVHLDPIEKKPLFHYLPGTQAFSIATAGCNFECKFCQNWRISQFDPEKVTAQFLPPQEIVTLTKRAKAPTIAYTYTEPVVFTEYMYDTAFLARKEKIGGVMITNGFINEKPLRDLCKVLTAVKVDFKAFNEKFYKDTCSGELKPVLKTLALLKKLGIWLEIVILIIPTLNDSEKENKAMSKWIVENLGKDVPVHFSRFQPEYKLKNLPTTPVRIVERCRAIALAEGIKFVYLGNVWNHEGESTYCPKCKAVVIKRVGYFVTQKNIDEKGLCQKCKEKIPGVWKNPLI